ncbi:MAG: hypothetical protein IPJ98_12920 [Bryobacterales bacterium]|nr:hypothetical protein [Bryobacterales bacterium]
MPSRSNLTRRGFLASAAGAAAGAAFFTPQMRAAAAQSEPLIIKQIDAVTFRKDIKIGGGSGGSDGAEFCWVRLHTSNGLTGPAKPTPSTKAKWARSSTTPA